MKKTRQQKHIISPEQFGYKKTVISGSEYAIHYVEVCGDEHLRMAKKWDLTYHLISPMRYGCDLVTYVGEYGVMANTRVR